MPADIAQGDSACATTIGALLERGDLGIGTIVRPDAHLDSHVDTDLDASRLDEELIIVDGAAFVASVDGSLRTVPGETTPRFAAVCRFSVFAHSPLRRPLGLRTLSEVLDAMAPGVPSVPAVRLDGDFSDLRLGRAQRSEWSLPSATGTVVGFRFPDGLAGVDLPGYHLHFVSDDRTQGGRVLDLTMSRGELRVGAGH